MNQEIIQQFLTEGKQKEQEFANCLQNNCGGQVISTDQQTDMKDHVDLIWKIVKVINGEVSLEHINREIKIDVKGTKRSSRSGQINEEIHWIELQNVRGKSGWLFGKADVFAFETNDYWILVGKNKLIEFIKIKIEGQTEVTNDNQSFYKLYGRNGRNDIIVKIKTIDLMALSQKILWK